MLTASKVHEIFDRCLFQDGEDVSEAVRAEGVHMAVGFNPKRLAAAIPEIKTLLTDLPDEFHANKGGGWSFLNACHTKDGTHWGEHADIDQLLCLGIAVGLVGFPLPKPVWSMLPGGMPYFMVMI